MRILAVVLAVVFLAVPVMAGPVDGVIDYVKNQETQSGIYYNFDDQATHAYVGRTLAQDVFVKNVDLALIWDIKDAIGLEASYIIKEGDVSPYVGLIAGTNRIENLDNGDLGEAFFAVSAGAKF